MSDIKERAKKYLDRAELLFKNLKIVQNNEHAKKFYEMAMSYYNDAIYFYNNGNFLEAIIALEYAEGWMDAGKFIGFLE